MEKHVETYYDILEVSRNDSPEVIKKAYLVLAKKYHPDSTSLSQEIASKKMVQLNKAYEVLSDPVKRKNYDTLLGNHDNHYSATVNQNSHIVEVSNELAILCEEILTRLKKEVLYSSGHEMSNEKTCNNLYNLFTLRATPLITQLNSISTKDMSNLKPVFYVLYQFGAAYTWTYDLNKSINCLKQSLSLINTYDKNYAIVCQTISDVEKLHKKRNRDALIGKIIIGIIIIGILYMVSLAVFPSSSSNKQSSKPSTSQTQTKNISPKNSAQQKPKKGISSQYVPGEPVLNTNGYSTLTIDNTQNDAPVYVRLWTSGTTPSPIRTFTVAAKENFTVEDIAPGTYEVRYKYLYENAEATTGAKSEPFTLTEERNNNGIYYDQMTLTLYTVRNGNTHMQQIDVSEI